MCHFLPQFFPWYLWLAALWGPVAGDENVWLLCRLVTLNSCIQQYPSGSRFLSKLLFLLDISFSLLSSGSCACVALKLSFLAISRFIFVVFFSCIVRDALFLDSVSTASIRLVKMYLPYAATMERCSSTPSIYWISFAEWKPTSLFVTLVSSTRLWYSSTNNCLKLAHFFSAVAFLCHSFNDRGYNPFFLTSLYAVCKICSGVNSFFQYCVKWISSYTCWKYTLIGRSTSIISTRAYLMASRSDFRILPYLSIIWSTRFLA